LKPPARSHQTRGRTIEKPVIIPEPIAGSDHAFARTSDRDMPATSDAAQEMPASYAIILKNSVAHLIRISEEQS